MTLLHQNNLTLSYHCISAEQEKYNDDAMCKLWVDKICCVCVHPMNLSPCTFVFVVKKISVLFLLWTVPGCCHIYDS